MSSAAQYQLRCKSPLFIQLSNKEYPEEAKKPFSLVDLEKISVHVKGMNLGLKAQVRVCMLCFEFLFQNSQNLPKNQANFFFSHAEYVESRTAGKDLASEYYQTAKSLYSEVLSSFPRSFSPLFSFSYSPPYLFLHRDCEALLNLAVTLTKILNIKYYEQPFPSDDGFPFSYFLPFFFPFSFLFFQRS